MSEHEFVTVRVSSELLARLVDGWSEPVQVRIEPMPHAEPVPHAEPPWEMTCRRPLVAGFVVKGIFQDGREVAVRPEDVCAVYTDDVSDLQVTKIAHSVPLASGECLHNRQVEYNLAAGIQRHIMDGTVCNEMIKSSAGELSCDGS